MVTGDRQRDYSHPTKNAHDIATMWGIILGRPVPPEKVGLMMAALKIVRHANGTPKRDNLVDLAGYAQFSAIVEGHDDMKSSTSGDEKGTSVSPHPPTTGQVERHVVYGK